MQDDLDILGQLPRQKAPEEIWLALNKKIQSQQFDALPRSWTIAASFLAAAILATNIFFFTTYQSGPTSSQNDLWGSNIKYQLYDD